jgi:hypothetical protein
MKNTHNPVPLPFHFKLQGRSYNQIGRKGNIALYSVYSDYLIIPDYALPYILLGYELIVIKVKHGREVYPSAWQFGKIAWAIPKSISRVCSACSRCCDFIDRQLGLSKSKTLVDRSTSSARCAALA